jgi:hypothetical protein
MLTSKWRDIRIETYCFNIYNRLVAAIHAVNLEDPYNPLPPAQAPVNEVLEPGVDELVTEQALEEYEEENEGLFNFSDSWAILKTKQHSLCR